MQDTMTAFSPSKTGALAVNLARFLTVKQVAERLGIPSSTISRYVANGLFPGAYKVNPYSEKRSAWRVPEEAVIAFEEKQRETARGLSEDKKKTN